MSNRALSRIAALLLVAFALGACEETVDITDVEYRERIVVYGILDAADSVDIRFTRTLPLNELYSEARAALADVDARLVQIDASGNAIFAHTLVHTGGGHYTVPGLRPASDTRYRLEASWHGKSIRSSARVPWPPQIDSADFIERIIEVEYDDRVDTARTVRAFVTPRDEEVYLLTTAIVDPRTGQEHINESYGAPLSRREDVDSLGRLELIDVHGYYSSRDPMMTNIAAAVVAFDEEYYEFSKTYYNRSDPGPFGSGSDNVNWTIDGDGIGLFTARAIATRPVR